MEIEYDVVKSTRELQKQGYTVAKIEKTLGELGYNQAQVQEIIDLASGVDKAELQGKSKKVLVVLIVAFAALITLMALAAILA